MFKTTVYCTVLFEATHNWGGCPFDEVDYLRAEHRHVFHIKAFKTVTHSDRDTEFIMLKHEIQEYLTDRYYDDMKRMGVLGHMSCEMLAEELIEQFELCKCEVNEDGENGCRVEVV